MPIHISYRINATLTTADDILSMSKDDLFEKIEPHYSKIADECVNLYKELWSYLRDQGYHFGELIEAYITVKPPVKVPINALNLIYLYLEKLRFRVQLPSNTYSISPLLENKEILQKFKRLTLLSNYLEHQLDFENNAVNEALTSDESIENYFKLCDNYIDEYIQWLSEQEKNSEIIISGVNNCPLLQWLILDDENSPSLTTKLFEPENDKFFMEYYKGVTLYYKFTSFSTTFESFKYLVVNVDKPVENLAKNLESLSNILLDCEYNLPLNDEKDVKVEKIVKQIGGLDSFRL